ncbi:MAG: hypothetical protein KA352_02075 [Flavobacteriales bacterium]|nr:hypothetical protein [Flavobacteriales bacterium]
MTDRSSLWIFFFLLVLAGCGNQESREGTDHLDPSDQIALPSEPRDSVRTLHLDTALSLARTVHELRIIEVRPDSTSSERFFEAILVRPDTTVFDIWMSGTTFAFGNDEDSAQARIYALEFVRTAEKKLVFRARIGSDGRDDKNKVDFKIDWEGPFTGRIMSWVINDSLWTQAGDG